MKKKIVIGSSVTFYNHIPEIKQRLLALGFEVLIPDVAGDMERDNNFDEDVQRRAYESYSPEMKKRVVTYLFPKLESSDAFLILNKEKHGLQGYIGPNVLMEMAVAVHLGKPVFLLQTPDTNLPAYGEIMAIGPIILDEDVSKIKNYLLTGGGI